MVMVTTQEVITCALPIFFLIMKEREKMRFSGYSCGTLYTLRIVRISVNEIFH
jgi:hypothetical protein